MIVGLGPVLAAIIARTMFRDINRPLPLYGNSVMGSLVFMLAPCMVLIVLGIKNQQHINGHLFAVKVCLFWLIYIFGEESGWRGYLQTQLKTNDYIKALVVGFLWYVWHLSFLLEKTSVERELIFLTVLILGSFIAIRVTNRTLSLLTSVGLHFSFSVMTNIPVPPLYKFGLTAMLIIWVMLLLKWPNTKPIKFKSY